MKNKRTCIFFSFPSDFSLQRCGPFSTFFQLSHCKPIYLEKHLSWDHDIWLTDCVQGVDDLINFWQNSVNIYLNYLPFPTLAFRVVKQPCEQNILRTV